MGQTTFDQELQRNRQAYEELRHRIRRDYSGQYVAIAQGRLVGHAATFEAASAAVYQLDPVPEHFVVFPADEEPVFDVFYDTSTEYL